jgi:hypothetical protein
MKITLIFLGVLTTGILTTGSDALAEGCRKVGPVDGVTINPQALKALGAIKIDRGKIFEALKDVSIPETSGCWSGASGNFDGQIVSVGTLQWNYGQNSLQPVLRKYQSHFGSFTAFQKEVSRLMPTYSKLVFSSGCIRTNITDDCKNAILAAQENGKLDDAFKNEWDGLFESDQMIQIQTDVFVALLQSVQDDLLRLFPNQEATSRRIKWAIDTKVQQGQFPGDADVKRVRDRWQGLDDNQKRDSLKGLVMWYHGLSASADQGGVRLDWNRNVEVWNRKIDAGAFNQEQADLLYLSFLKSRIAQGQSGYWQALTFQRRLKIILGAGCVGGDCAGI